MVTSANLFRALNATLPTELKSQPAVLDGEIVCLDADGKSQFEDLLFRRGEPRFMRSICSGSKVKTCVSCH
jgi:ATP-dependent DNA ligase